MKSFIFRVALALAAMLSASAAFAQYPNRPITVVFGFPPGTILDTSARLITDEMSRRLGQPVVFQFKPGANGTIAAKFVANAAPDGYTLLYGNMMTSHPILNRHNAVDPVKELTPISLTATAAYFLYVRASLPISSVQQLLAYEKANPGKLTYGSPQAGIDMAFHMFKARGAFLPFAIPYKSTPQVINAMLAGDVDMAFSGLTGWAPHVESGKVRPLFYAHPSRSSSLPQIPSNVEAGFPGLDLGSLYSLWAPLGTPKEIIDKLSAEAARATRLPMVSDRLRTAFHAEPVGSTPQENLAGSRSRSQVLVGGSPTRELHAGIEGRAHLIAGSAPQVQSGKICPLVFAKCAAFGKLS